MAERRIKLSPEQRTELLAIWQEMVEARKQAATRVAALLNLHHLSPETPGRLSVDPDGALVFLVRDEGGTSA